MTQREHQNIIRICGLGYEWEDIPAYIRQREGIEKSDWDFAGKAKQDAENQKNLLSLDINKYIMEQIIE